MLFDDEDSTGLPNGRLDGGGGASSIIPSSYATDEGGGCGCPNGELVPHVGVGGLEACPGCPPVICVPDQGFVCFVTTFEDKPKDTGCEEEGCACGWEGAKGLNGVAGAKGIAAGGACCAGLANGGGAFPNGVDPKVGLMVLLEPNTAVLGAALLSEGDCPNTIPVPCWCGAKPRVPPGGAAVVVTFTLGELPNTSFPVNPWGWEFPNPAGAAANPDGALGVVDPNADGNPLPAPPPPLPKGVVRAPKPPAPLLFPCWFPNPNIRWVKRTAAQQIPYHERVPIASLALSLNEKERYEEHDLFKDRKTGFLRIFEMVLNQIQRGDDSLTIRTIGKALYTQHSTNPFCLRA
jgi:hypothetical protein